MLELNIKTTASVMELHRAIHSQCPVRSVHLVNSDRGTLSAVSPAIKAL